MTGNKREKMDYACDLNDIYLVGYMSNVLGFFSSIICPIEI